MATVLNRAKMGVAASAAFVGGLFVASAFNVTPFGYAQQQSATASRPPAQVVQPVADMNNAFVSIAEHVTPAVVSIQTEHIARTAPTGQGQGRLRPRGQQGQVPPGLEDFFDQFDPNQRQRAPVEGSGSGFIVSSDGYIMTNNHVVADADRVTVGLPDKRTFTAKVIGRDPTTDIAVIKIDGSNFPTVPLGNDETARVGEWVLAIGNPLQLDFTVTAGIISAKGRTNGLQALYNARYAIVDYIQTDAAINPGNSGGPLVNIRGEVIGINSAIASPTGYNAGYGFAIPITLAKSVMNDLIKNGHVRRAVLGISINDVKAEDAQVAGLKEIRGAKVEGFDPSDGTSPARRAGIEAGDVIVAINGKPVDRVASLQRIIRDSKPGDEVEVNVMRYGQSKTFKVKLAEAPSETVVAATEPAVIPGAVKPTSYDKIGITVEPISADRARQADLSEAQRGLIVTDVDVNGPAYHATNPIRPGLIVMQVLAPGPRLTVHSAAELDQALSRVKRGDIVSLLMLDPRANPKQTFVANLRVGS
ncbi:MAG: Do family serine endopeptidase [Gemmatimonadaceae bacterium]